MSVWETMKSWMTKNAQHLVYARIPANRTDVAASPPVKAHEGYVRVFLSDMFLTKSRAWFTDRFPCVSTQVRLDLDGKRAAAISHVARPPDGMLAPGVRINHPVTDLLPYSGNVVEVEAALLALKGQGYLNTALDVLGTLSSLVPGPVGTAIGIAKEVANGVEKLVDEGDGAIHLGLHDSFGSQQSPLQAGYLAVVLATAAQVSPASLGVHQNRLFTQLADGSWKPLEGFDYMLYFIETARTRDDWRLPAIESALSRAIEAVLLEPGDRAEAYKKAAIVAALTCKELTPLDRRRVAAAVKEEIEAAQGLGQGGTRGETPGLESIVKTRAPSADLTLAELPTEDELLA